MEGLEALISKENTLLFFKMTRPRLEFRPASCQLVAGLSGLPLITALIVVVVLLLLLIMMIIVMTKSEIIYLNTCNYPHSSFTNRCTFIKILITIYIKIRWLLHVSV